MAEKGLPRVTVRDVAARAGVQPALVNYYFGSKEGLFRAVVVGVAARMQARIEERLRSVVRAVTAHCVEEPYAPRLVMEQVLFGEDEMIDTFVAGYARPNLETVSELLEAGAEAGEVRPVEPLFLIPSLLGGCLFFFLASPLIMRLFELDAITPELAEELADNTVDVLLHGISARPGRAS